MASTFTTSLRLEVQATGENRASWGSKTNTNLLMLEEAISGVKVIAMPDANYTLTKVNAGTDDSRPMFLRFTGALTADRTITIPTVSKLFFVQNLTSGSKNIIITTSGGPNTYAISSGQWKMIFTDGSSIFNNDILQTQSHPLRRWGIDPVVYTDGTMEIGRFIDFHNSNVDAGDETDYAVRLDTGGTTTDLYVGPKGLTGKKIWHSGNDGAASGMDADLLDGKHASEIYSEPPNDGKLYARRTSGGVSSWVAIDAPWTIDTNSDVILRFGGTIKVRIRTDGFIRTASDVQIYSTTVVSGG